MNYFKFHRCLFVILSALFVSLPVGSQAAQAIIIDHTCTDTVKIPDFWINQVKSALKIHYAHTSHGEQLLEGSSRLMAANPRYNYYPDNCRVPVTPDYMSLMDGQYYDDYCETYVSPDLYWEGVLGLTMTRSVLNSFEVNVSMWAWCSQLDYYSQAEVQAYLNNLAQLESEYPGVTFVYMTGNAQGSDRNRVDRNNQIREFCRQNNKILFDFADLDCWYNGEQYTVDGIPMEHPRYNGDEAAHTTFESCENKARAFWWLLARIAGWDGANVSPLPDVKANGQDGPVVVSPGAPVSIGISLDSGDKAGQNADWWLLQLTPDGNLHYFDLGTLSMMAGYAPTLQAGLVSFADIQILSLSGLQEGTHSFYFGVDLAMNGELDIETLYYDYVQVDAIGPAGGPPGACTNSLGQTFVPAPAWHVHHEKPFGRAGKVLP